MLSCAAAWRELGWGNNSSSPGVCAQTSEVLRMGPFGTAAVPCSQELAEHREELHLLLQAVLGVGLLSSAGLARFLFSECLSPLFSPR